MSRLHACLVVCMCMRFSMDVCVCERECLQAHDTVLGISRRCLHIIIASNQESYAREPCRRRPFIGICNSQQHLVHIVGAAHWLCSILNTVPYIINSIHNQFYT